MKRFSPIPFEVLLGIYCFAVAVGYLRWRYWIRGTDRFSSKARWMIFGGLMGAFVALAAFNAFWNHRLGLPQF